MKIVSEKSEHTDIESDYEVHLIPVAPQADQGVPVGEAGIRDQAQSGAEARPSTWASMWVSTWVSRGKSPWPRLGQTAQRNVLPVGNNIQLDQRRPYIGKYEANHQKAGKCCVFLRELGYESKWSNYFLREDHRFQTSTQPLGMQWQVLVLGSLEQLKYTAHCAYATLTGKCHIFVRCATSPCAAYIAQIIHVW